MTVRRPERVLYGHYYLHQSFAFGEESEMRAWAREIEQIEACATLGDALQLAQHLEHAWAPGLPESEVEMEEEGLTPADAYAPRESAAAADGDWPPMPTGFALDTFDADDDEAWGLLLGDDVGGSVVSTTLNGDYLLIPEDREAQLLAAFATLGVVAVRDDSVIAVMAMW